MPENKPKKPGGRDPSLPGGRYATIKSLRLDLQAAIDGKTWLLLPEGFRSQPNGSTYPLPAKRLELQKLAAIYIPPYSQKQDVGCVYLRRALAEWKKRQQRTNSAMLDLASRQESVKKSQENYRVLLKGLREDARKAVQDVREEAVHAIASLNDLFSLGRKGIEGQMKAHLEGKKWPHAEDCTPEKCSKSCKGEHINANAFRQCFRMVTQAVKGLGLPSDQRKEATSAVVEELASSLKATQQALAETSLVADAPGDGEPN